ncbi:MAG: nucleotidyl transferase AbiEii/AbiGii toxin family protein [Candidatus Uhrbacteria bacterium]
MVNVDKDRVKIDLALEILPPSTKRAFEFCTKEPFFSKDWYLAGGTAMALQVGHRQSVDLDFFTPRGEFDEAFVEREMFNTGKWETTFREKGTLYGKYRGAKMSFIAYPFFHPSRKKIKVGNVNILIVDDIAVMKIIAISQRGRKRDFFDLFWYCQNREPLINVLQRVAKQYPEQKHNFNHIVKSLTYFEDAENDLMPVILFRINWHDVKKFFLKEAKTIAQELFLSRPLKLQPRKKLK